MLNKKALAAGQLVTIIIVLIAFVLIAFTVTRFMSKAEDKESEILCQSSIALRTMTTMQVKGTDVNLAPVLCKTIDKEISGNREEIKEQLAYMMARCWWMFGEGRHEELLDDPELMRRVLDIDKSENDCFLCYTALIDENEIEGGPIHSSEMFNYLVENNHRQIKGTTYLDYIQSYGGPGKAAVTENIGPREAYGIVYMAKNKEQEGDSWTSWLFAAGIAAGAAIGITVCIATVACALTLTAGSVAVVATSAAISGASYYAAWNQFKIDYYGTERDVSVVTLDHLKGIEAGGCDVRDLAGE